MSVVRLTSPWTRIIEYPENHLNDFCLFRAHDGRWHAIGIMGTGTWASETSLFHCSSDGLAGAYEKHEPLLAVTSQGTTANAAPQKHAPFVVGSALSERGGYQMFYRRPYGTSLRVRSDDLFHWSDPPEVVFEENDARDACIQCFDGVYHWYYCQWRVVNGVGRSCILLRRSDDLERWSEAVAVHVNESREVKHSHLESPFVIHEAGRYWLFVRDRSQDARCLTTVFASPSPDRFASGVHAWDAELENVHAPELVRWDGRWYIARVSGPPDHVAGAPKRGGWIDLAEIAFGD